MAYKDVMDIGVVSDRKSLENILNNVSFASSCVDLGYKYHIEELGDTGFLMSFSFFRPDTHTGEMGEGFGREWFVRKNSTEKFVVMTAKLAIDLIITHEILESFHYLGTRLLDPHKSIESLAYPEKLGQEKINLREIKNS